MEDKSVVFVDENNAGKEIMKIPEPVMYDGTSSKFAVS